MFGGDGYTQFLDYGDGSMSVGRKPNRSRCIH